MASRNSFKVIILGTTGVGKTCLAVRQCKEQYRTDIAPTTGTAHFRTLVKVDGQEVELKIWDTAGQEQFASLVPMYARGSHVCILVGAMDSAASIAELDSWREKLTDYGEQPPVVVAVNKADLAETADFAWDEVRETLQEKYDHVFLVSAKTGYFVEELFGCAAKQALEYSIKIHPSGPELADTDQKRCC